MAKLFKYCIIISLFLVPCVSFAQPNADFTANVTAGCEPLLVQFNAHSSTQSSSYTHSWNLGGTNSTQTNPSKIFVTSGTYTITHTVTGPGGTSTEAKTGYITVHPKPTVDFEGTPLLGCPPLSVNFTDKSTLNTSGAGTYFWIFTNSAPSTAQNPTNVYNDGPYDVTLKVINSKGCPAELTKKKYVDVYDKPTVTFTANVTEFCTAPASVSFTSNVSGNLGPYTYDWDFGDGSTHATTQNTTHTFNGPSPKDYTITLTVTDKNNCKTVITKTKYIKIYDPKANFSAPDTVCLNQSVSFTNTSNAGTTGQKWNFADGSPEDINVNTTHTYNTPGKYDVRLVVFYGNGCSDTVIKPVVVRSRPDVNFYIDPDTLCPAPQTVQFFTDSVFSIYKWDFGDDNNNTSTQATPTHTYNKNGQYSVTFIGEDRFGCRDTLEKYLYVKLFPMELHAFSQDSLTAPDTSGCIPLKLYFKNNLYRDSGIVYPYPVKTYTWDFGDGNTSNLKEPVYTYTDTGRFRVILDVETIQGCTISDTFYVEAGITPTADFIASPLIVCNNQEVYFTNKSIGWPPMKYRWDFGDGGISSSPNPVYTYSQPDTYNVKLTALHYGCFDTFEREQYIIVLVPDAKFAIDPLVDCNDPLTKKFTNTSIGADSVFWRLGDGTTTSQNDPSHTYPANGSYVITIIAYNFTTGCVDSAKQNIYIGENPPDFIQNKRQLCEGDSVSFWGYRSMDTSFGYFDYYINGKVVSTAEAYYTHTFDTAGLYTITVVSTDDDGCKDTVEKVNWITVGGPKVGFVTDTPFVCMPDTVFFTDTSYTHAGTNIANRLWRFGTGPNDTLFTTSNTATKFYDSVGDYNVTLVVTDNIGCKDSLVLPEHVHALKPVAGFTVDKDVCVHDTVLFTNKSTNAASNVWTFGDGNGSTAYEPKHIYRSKGFFNPRLIVTDSIGCKDTAVYNSIQTRQPNAGFTLSDSISICPNFIVKFTNTSTNYRTLRWDFDNGNFATLKDPTTIFTDPNEYNVKLIVKDSFGCADTATRKVQVLGYGGAFSYDTTSGCVPLTVNFESDVNGQVPSMIWDFGDGVTKQINQSGTISYTYLTPGKYVPQMVFNDGLGCNTTSEGIDTIYVDDVDADFEVGPACQYEQVQFFDKSTNYLSAVSSTRWEFHDASISVLKDPKKKYGPPGRYDVQLIATNANGCKDTLDSEVVINEPLPVSAGADTIICLGDSATLTPSGGVTYVWSPVAKLSCDSCENPKAFPIDSSMFTVISTDINGCHDTADVWVGIKTHVTSIAGGDGEICYGETRQLNVSGAVSYAWIPSTGLNDATSPQPIATPPNTIIYTVVAYEGSCIPDTNRIEVIVHPLPEVNVQGEATIVAGNTADLLATGKYIARYEWSPSNTLSCVDCRNPIAEPYKTTRYVVRVFTKYECVDSADVTITVLCDKSQVFIPNTFTPNGDGVNDIFYVRGVGIENISTFRIFSRWGELLFERNNIQINDKQNSWDGTFNGEVLPPDVYMYIVEGDCENGDKLQWKGDVTIIR